LAEIAVPQAQLKLVAYRRPLPPPTLPPHPSVASRAHDVRDIRQRQNAPTARLVFAPHRHHFVAGGGSSRLKRTQTIEGLAVDDSILPQKFSPRDRQNVLQKIFYASRSI